MKFITPKRLVLSVVAVALELPIPPFTFSPMSNVIPSPTWEIATAHVVAGFCLLYLVVDILSARKH